MSYYYRGSRPMVSGRGRGRGNTSRGRGRGFDSGNPFLGGVGPSDGIEFDPKDVFQIERRETFSGDADVLHKPNVLGCYSVDSEREFGHDKSLLRFVDTQYLQEEGKLQVPLDLNRGRDKHNMYTGSNKKNFQDFLNWILNNQECARESSERLTTDFISLRGNFIKIMRTPYDILSWTMYATEFKGSIYILNWPTEEFLKEQKKPEMDDISKWGPVFEHYMRGGKLTDNNPYCLFPRNLVVL
ncbi:decapping and exoribonuclease protein-like [Palaemon carinicauda]|uniref:decapping and exoribonuclease protein-like n=1 Tax=Palaemon carinicauda TaxID=392227 RepID=UPI0035B57833